MLRRLATLGAALGALLVASPASAQQAAKSFGDQGEFIFGADRLFPLFSFTTQTLTVSNTTNSTTVTGTSITLLGGTNSTVLGGGGTGVLVAGNPTFYNVPRVGFDYTIIPNLTIGGEAIVFFTLGGSTSNGAGSTGNPGGNAFGIAPRVGYIFNLTDVFAVWPRAGLFYYDANYSNQNIQFNRCNDTANGNVFGLTLDPVLTISPVQHFAFTVGPTLDWGFTGGFSGTQPTAQDCSKTTTQSFGYSALDFSINAGMLGWF